MADVNIRTLGGSARAISTNGADVRVHSSLLFADDLVFGGNGGIRIANSGIEAFTNVTANGSNAVAYVGSYNDATLLDVGATCN